jgi:hypothetical protein
MHRRFIAWLAIFGIAFNALWPLAVNAAPLELQATVCSAGKPPPAVPAKQIPASSSLPHCPFCLGAGDQTPALTANRPVTFERAIFTFAAAVAGSFAGQSFVHPSAAPRGPPQLPELN